MLSEQFACTASAFPGQMLVDFVPSAASAVSFSPTGLFCPSQGQQPASFAFSDLYSLMDYGNTTGQSQLSVPTATTTAAATATMGPGLYPFGLIDPSTFAAFEPSQLMMANGGGSGFLGADPFGHQIGLTAMGSDEECAVAINANVGTVGQAQLSLAKCGNAGQREMRMPMGQLVKR
jgi:hypothetical protein